MSCTETKLVGGGGAAAGAAACGVARGVGAGAHARDNCAAAAACLAIATLFASDLAFFFFRPILTVEVASKALARKTACHVAQIAALSCARRGSVSFCTIRVDQILKARTLRASRTGGTLFNVGFGRKSLRGGFRVTKHVPGAGLNRGYATSFSRPRLRRSISTPNHGKCHLYTFQS